MVSVSAGLMPIEARGNYLPKPPYLRETKTYHSQPLESIRHDGSYFVSLSIWPIFIFCCRSYVKLLDYWRAEKKFLYFRRPPFGLRPVAFATSATCLIWHWWVYVFTCWSLCVECIACSFSCHGTGRLSRISVDMPFYYSFQCAVPSGM